MMLAAAVERHAQAAPARLALRCGGEEISYGALWQRSNLAAAVLHGAGLRPGDRVAYLGLNDPALLALLLALSMLDAILLPLNYRLAPEEQAAIARQAGARWIVADAAHAAPARQLAAALGARLLAAADLQSAAPPLPADARCGTAQSPLLMVPTSGTSGRPKLALHTQAALLANCAIAIEAFRVEPTDQVLSVLPLFHVGGLCIQTLPALVAGASVTLHARFEPGAWLADVQALRPSLSLLVPAALRAVLQYPGFAGADLSSLRLLGAGSSTIPQAQISAMHARGVPLCQIYGATETGPVSICLAPADAMEHEGSAGRAAPGVQVRLVDARGADVPDDAVGEILVQGPNLMSGYWQEAPPRALADGWFHSGDLARRDAGGFYWVVGRSTDLIISGGENIYPAELEQLLAEDPRILEAVVFGQSDPRWGEVPVVVLVRAPGAALDAAAVLALFEGRLARYKTPKRVLFVDALPKTALGKVRRAALPSLLA